LAINAVDAVNRTIEVDASTIAQEKSDEEGVAVKQIHLTTLIFV
jgi:hypothetical protein